jgi:hypothetical protein
MICKIKPYDNVSENDIFSVSPLNTALSPVSNNPADNKIPAVLSIVDTAPAPNTRNPPLTVPDPVNTNDNAADKAFTPAAAADHAQVLRGDV